MHVTLVVNDNVEHPALCLLDTGARPNIVNRSFIQMIWIDQTSPEENRCLCSASNNPLSVSGKIFLFVRTGDWHIKKWFLVADVLAVDILLGTAFIKRFFKFMLPAESRAVTFDSKPVAIFPSPSIKQKLADTLSSAIGALNEVRVLFRAGISVLVVP